MKNLSNYLFLLLANLSQQQNKEQVIRLFVEGVDSLLPDFKLKWSNHEDGNLQIPVSTRKNTFGYISYSMDAIKNNEHVFVLMQNAVQMLAVILERLQQEDLLKNKKENLESKVIIQNKVLKKQNEEYQALNEEYKTLNEELLKAKDQAEASHSQLEYAQRIAHIGSWFLDLETNELTWTDEEYRLFNLPIGSEISNSKFNDFIIDEDKSLVEAGFEKLLHGETYDVAFRIKVANEIKWIYESGKADFDENNEAISITGVSYDITKLKMAEMEQHAANEELIATTDALSESYNELAAANEKIKNNQQQLKDAQRIAKLGHWELNIEENKLTWSDEIYRIFDLKPQQFKATYEAFLEHIHPEDRVIVNKAYTDSLQNKTDYEIEHRLLLPSGELKYVREKCYTNFDGEGKALFSKGTVLDITKSKQIELKIKEQNEEYLTLNEEYQKQNEELLITKGEIEISEERFRAISEQASEGITLADKEGNYVFVNASFCKMVQYTNKELLQMKVFDMLADSDVENIKLELFGIPTEFVLKRKDQTIFPIQITVNQIVIANEQLLLGMVTDITEQKQNEQQLIQAKEKAEESDRLKTEFIHNMSHEIRTPLNGIMGFSSLLNNPNLATSKRKQFIHIIQNNGKQLVRIIDDILEISQLGTQQVKIKKEFVCINSLLLDLFSVFNIRAKENKIPLYLKKGLSDSASTTFTDNVKLNKIISKLIDNALKFTNEGFIELGNKLVEIDGIVYMQIYVKDTGIGINKEKQELIFDRFSQEEKEGKVFGGLGLGLSIAKENSELLGGFITLLSEKGKGSSFFVTIPYQPKDEEKQEHLDLLTQTKQQKKYCILIAEDEEINFLYLEALLESEIELKCKLIHAKNGKEAVTFCEENQNIDLVLMDLKMPVMNGYEATKIIKRMRPSLPVVAQTAYSTDDDRDKALAAGCDQFISKPINEKLFAYILSKYIKL